jgi:hypothetical protein
VPDGLKGKLSVLGPFFNVPTKPAGRRITKPQTDTRVAFFIEAKERWAAAASKYEAHRASHFET